MKEKTIGNSAVTAVQGFIRLNGGRRLWSRADIRKLLLGHPDFPSPVAALETLELMGFPCREGGEGDFPALMRFKTGEWGVLEKEELDRLIIRVPGGLRRKLSVRGDDELNEPDGPRIVLAAPPTPRAAGGVGQSFSALFPAVLVFLMASLLLILQMGFSWSALLAVPERHALWSLCAVKLLGLILSTWLAIDGVPFSGGYFFTCASGSGSGCRKAAESPVGAIAGVAMSEIGWLYFSGGITGLWLALAGGDAPRTIAFLGFLNLFTLPYTLFSVFYQGVILRAWCRLCLLIQALFWIEFNISAPFLVQHLKSALHPIPLAPATGFVLAAALGFMLKRMIQLRERNDALETENLKRRSDPAYIGACLANVPLTPTRRFSAETEWGDAAAPYEITLIMDPLCVPCGVALQEFRELISMFPRAVRGILRLETSTAASSSVRGEDVAAHLLGVALEDGAEAGRRAVEEWFSLLRSGGAKRFRKWRRGRSLNSSSAVRQAELLLNEHREWLKTIPVEATPRLLLNGALFPRGFSSLDLRIFLLRNPQPPNAV